MAISANGLIAKKDDDTSWISKQEWDQYSLAVRTAGNLIVGRRTYHILTQQPEFSELKEVKVAVVSKDTLTTSSPNHHVVHSPRAALKRFEGANEVIVAGGGILNASFLEQALVDEVCLDIEPIIIGEGIPLFKGTAFERELKLLGQKRISDNEIQLHYKIVR